MSRALPSRMRGARERGVASLIIVALLFFVLSLAAAYANRNLIFEQRTSANQYRSTMALEAAEAGAEWALALLNSGSIGDTCQPSDDPTDTTFRERYLRIAPDTGLVTAAVPDASARGTVWPSCVFDGTDWRCSCPTEGDPDLDAPAGDGPLPAFRVRLSRASTTQPSLVLVEVNGCTRLADDCLDFPSRSLAGEGRATVSVLAALRTALPALPVAPLTLREGLNVGASALGAFNSERQTTGITILAGGAIDATTRAALRLGSLGGTPGELSLYENDPALADAAMTGARLFESTFAATATAFREQPAVRLMTECDATCDAATIRTIADLNRGRILWVDGDVDFDSDGDIGSANAPVMIIATGDIRFSSPVTVYGLLYSRAATWTSSGAGEVRGAALAEGGFAGTASTSFVYDRAVLQRLQWQHGSFVRVPGGWADFKEAP